MTEWSVRFGSPTLFHLEWILEFSNNFVHLCSLLSNWVSSSLLLTSIERIKDSRRSSFYVLRSFRSFNRCSNWEICFKIRPLRHSTLPKRRELVSEGLLLLSNLLYLKLLLWSDPVPVHCDVYLKWLRLESTELPSPPLAFEHLALLLPQRLLEELLSASLSEDLLKSATVLNDIRVATCTIRPVFHRHRLLSWRWRNWAQITWLKRHIMSSDLRIVDSWNTETAIIVHDEAISTRAIWKVMLILGIEGSQI